MRERWRVVALLAVNLLVYANSLFNGFTMDDELYIFRNPSVTNFSLKALFEPTSYGNVFRPVTFATFAFNWALGSSHAFGYHLLNLLFHAAVTLLLYLLLCKLLESVPQALTISFAAALLFAVHPIHTEAVASIVGRSELLAAGFVFAAWLLHLNGRQVPALLCFVLAMSAKESAVVFIPLVLAGDLARGSYRPIRCYVWITSVAAAHLALLWKVQGGRFGEKQFNPLDNPLASLPASLRILNAFRIAWKYVGLHVYPAALSCDYSYNAILLYAGWRHTAPAVLAALLGLALWIWTFWTRRTAWVLAGALYLCGFAVTSNILIATGTIMGERLAYLPSAGFCLLVALIWSRLANHKQKLAWTVLVILAATLAGRTIARNRDWRDNFTLYSAGVRAVPESCKMHMGLGETYVKRGELDLARTEFQSALRIYPDYPEALEVYGLLESRTGHDQEAVRLLESAVARTGKDNYDYHFRVVNLAAQLVKVGEKDRALALLDQVISDSPADARAWSNRAVLLYSRGEYAEALKGAQMALRLDPANAQALNLLAMLRSASEASPTQ